MKKALLRLTVCFALVLSIINSVSAETVSRGEVVKHRAIALVGCPAAGIGLAGGYAVASFVFASAAVLSGGETLKESKEFWKPINGNAKEFFSDNCLSHLAKISPLTKKAAEASPGAGQDQVENAHSKAESAR